MNFIEDLLELAVNEGEKAGADFIEARFEDLKSQVLIREKDTLKDVLSARRRGIGITAYYKGVQGFSSTADLSQNEIKETAIRAVKIARVSEPIAQLRLPFEKDSNLPDMQTPVEQKVTKHPSRFDLSFKKELVDRTSATALSFNNPKWNYSSFPIMIIHVAVPFWWIPSFMRIKCIYMQEEVSVLVVVEFKPFLS